MNRFDERQTSGIDGLGKRHADALRAYCLSQEPPPLKLLLRSDEPVAGATPERRRSGGLVFVLAVGIVIVALLPIGLLSPQNEAGEGGAGDSPSVSPPGLTSSVPDQLAPTESSAAVPDESEGPATQDWVFAPPNDVEGRLFPSITVTGDRVVVWGGRDVDNDVWHASGASLDPESLEWTMLAEGPLAPRNGHVAVWTGRELIVCCGRMMGSGESAGAYDPSADSWRAIAAPPSSPIHAHAIWTGDRVIVFGGITSGGDTPSLEAFSYDPIQNLWTELSDMPYSAERASASVWSGDMIYVWPDPEFGRQTHTPMAFDPADNVWSELPDLPDQLVPISPSLVWTGTEIIAWGVDSTGSQDVGVGLRIRPGDTSWSSIADSPLPPSPPFEGNAGSQGATWTGDEMLIWPGWIGASNSGDASRLISYNPLLDTWRQLEDAPTSVVGLYLDPLVWTGSYVLVYTQVEPIMRLTPGQVDS